MTTVVPEGPTFFCAIDEVKRRTVGSRKELEDMS